MLAIASRYKAMSLSHIARAIKRTGECRNPQIREYYNEFHSPR
jgi:hypothetical protein